jgi:hypothetical protein
MITPHKRRLSRQKSTKRWQRSVGWRTVHAAGWPGTPQQARATTLCITWQNVGSRCSKQQSATLHRRVDGRKTVLRLRWLAMYDIATRV